MAHTWKAWLTDTVWTCANKFCVNWLISYPSQNVAKTCHDQRLFNLKKNLCFVGNLAFLSPKISSVEQVHFHYHINNFFVFVIRTIFKHYFSKHKFFMAQVWMHNLSMHHSWGTSYIQHVLVCMCVCVWHRKREREGVRENVCLCFVCACVRVCVCERKKDRESVCVCVYVRMCVCVRARVCVC